MMDFAVIHVRQALCAIRVAYKAHFCIEFFLVF